MGRTVAAAIATTAIIFITPIIVYGVLAKPLRMNIPQGASPAMFLLSTLVSKIGTAVAMCFIYYFAGTVFSDRIIVYILLWWILFVVGEIGQALGSGYSWQEAVSGIISETIYVPCSVLAMKAIIGL